MLERDPSTRFRASSTSLRMTVYHHMKTIKVCAGPVCKNRGTERIKEKIETDLQNQTEFDNINVEFCSCRGNCEFGPNIEVNGNVIGEISESNVIEKIKNAPEEKIHIKIEDNFLNDI